jgi:caffeoyl-CoA O-methyltransferase
MIDAERLKQQYIELFSTPEDPLLARINRDTHLHVLNPRMISGSTQGKLLEFISRMIQPRFILEIGTYTGYSAICLAKGLKDGGKLFTIERNEEIIRYPLGYIQEIGFQDRIEVLVGDALKIIPPLPFIFDLVFIDGDKKEYCEYYNQVIDKVRSNGYILADNVFWNSKVFDNKDQKDKDTQGIIAFNEMVLADSRVENIILPMRDGISFIRKL